MELVKVMVRFLTQIAEMFIRHCAERNGRAGDHAHIGVTNRIFTAYIQLCMLRVGFVDPVCAAKDNRTSATRTFFRSGYFLMALFYDMSIKFLCKAPSAKKFERMSEYKEEKTCLVRNDG